MRHDGVEAIQEVLYLCFNCCGQFHLCNQLNVLMLKSSKIVVTSVISLYIHHKLHAAQHTHTLHLVIIGHNNVFTTLKQLPFCSCSKHISLHSKCQVQIKIINIIVQCPLQPTEGKELLSYTFIAYQWTNFFHHSNFLN